MIRGRREERGGVLLEFALSMGVLWMVVAGTIELGRMVAAGHLVQGAARSGARTLALASTPANDTFADAIERIFDPDYLVIDVASCDAQGLTVSELGDDLPLLNRLLLPLMIRESRTVDGTPRELVRYPGTLVRHLPAPPDKPCATAYTVAVPELRSGGGATTVCWHRVVEELPGPAGESRFDLGCPGTSCGLAGLEVHYPFQSAAFPAWRDTGEVLPDGRPVRRVAAWNEGAPGEPLQAGPAGDDSCPSLTAAIGDTAQTGVLGDPGSLVDPYGGPLGLGALRVMPRITSGPSRAYRKVLTGTALYPREGFL